jgi:superfamily II DNA or RNA helicase
MSSISQLDKLLALIPNVPRSSGRRSGAAGGGEEDFSQLIAERLGALIANAATSNTRGVSSKEGESEVELVRRALLGLAPLFRHGAWDVRRAAAACLEKLAPIPERSGSKVESMTSMYSESRITLDVVDIPAILARGTPLLSCAPAGLAAELEQGGVEVRLSRQRRQLLRCIGMSTDDEASEASFYGGVAALITDADICREPAKPLPVSAEESSMSARMLNRKRRKEAQLMGGGKRKRQSSASASRGDLPEYMGFIGRGGGDDGQDLGGALACADKSATCQELLLLLSNDLCFQLFDQRWECRHGSALALVALLRGRGVQRWPKKWMKDVVARSICLLSLDRFGDYSAGTMVSPVRDTVAQVLGLAATALNPAELESATHKLSELTQQVQWEVRHGGTTGLLATAAVVLRRGGTSAALSGGGMRVAWDAGLRGLADIEEEVCAVSARMLRCMIVSSSEPKLLIDEIPTPGRVIDAPPRRKRNAGSSPLSPIQSVVNAVWAALDDVQYDDISCCIANILQLLDSCCSLSQGHNVLSGESWPIPRLLSLWNHRSSAVRCCVPRIVKSLQIYSPDSAGSGSVMRRCVWGLLHDVCEEAREACRATLVGCTCDNPALAKELLCMYFLPDGHMNALDELQPPCSSPMSYGARWRSCKSLVDLLPCLQMSEEALKHTAAPWACQREAAFKMLSYLKPDEQIWERVHVAASQQLGQQLPKDCSAITEESLPFQELFEDFACLQTARTESLRAMLNHFDEEESTASSFWTDRIAEMEARVLMGLADLNRRVSCAAVACVVASGAIGMDMALNPLFRPIMDSIKMEGCAEHRTAAALTIAAITRALQNRIMQRDAAEKLPVAICKLLTNLNNFVCEPSSTGRHHGGSHALSIILAEAMEGGVILNWLKERMRPLVTLVPSTSTSHALLLSALALVPIMAGCPPSADVKSLMQSDQLLEGLVQAARRPPPQDSKAPDLSESIRALSCTAIASLVKIDSRHTWAMVRRLALPNLFMTGSVGDALADAKFVVALVDSMGSNLVPHAPEILPSVLRGTTNPDSLVRHVLSGILSRIVGFAAVSGGYEHDPERSEEDGVDSLQRDGLLIYRHLIRGEMLPTMSPASLPCTLKYALGLEHSLRAENQLTLRHYQWEGVAWLDFLRRVGAHGILADEMGLGKTLQALIAVALAFCAQRTCSKNASFAPPALIICPPTLVSHWMREASSRFGKFFKPISLCGTPAERQAALKSLDVAHASFPLAVASYSALRADASSLSAVPWTSVVVDEAHLLRNPDTKLAVAARSLQTNHRLALTGTPIQNTVLELWSIFEFTMPGYLGSRSDFARDFAVPAAEALGTSADAPAAIKGFAALEKLHRLVLPFVLRREKSRVLAELPPKIITDVACDMSPEQRELHDALCHASEAAAALKALKDALQDDPPSSGTLSRQHSSSPPSAALKWLTVLQRLCVHPALAIPEGANHANRKEELLASLETSGKLVALRQLLWDAGIGLAHFHEASGDAASEESARPSDGTASKVLVFAQRRASLDIVESCLLKPLLPSVAYLRMDGSTPPAKRAQLVLDFCSNDSVSIFLLTTRVGGLGLNLTAADTVIFLEHDWNPQADLQVRARGTLIVLDCALAYSTFPPQAMDRAHRIGQKRCLSVYRLVMVGSIEERIMALQQHKLRTAEAVVNTDNSSLYSMDTKDVLGLLDVATQPSAEQEQGLKKQGVDIFADLSWSLSDYDYLDAESFSSTIKS